MTFGRVEISGGFLLLAALLFYLDGDGVLLWALAACAIHEGGHWAAIRLLGGDVRQLRLTVAGAEMRLGAARPLSPGRLLVAALAGPGANLAAALVSARLARHGLGGRLYLFAGLHLGLACFNLLPAAGLDGGRALRAAGELLWSAEAGERATALGSAGAAALLLFSGLCLLWHSGGRNFTLLLAGVWLAGIAGRQRVSGAF